MIVVRKQIRICGRLARLTWNNQRPFHCRHRRYLHTKRYKWKVIDVSEKEKKKFTTIFKNIFGETEKNPKTEKKKWKSGENQVKIQIVIWIIFRNGKGKIRICIQVIWIFDSLLVHVNFKKKLIVNYVQH